MNRLPAAVRRSRLSRKNLPSRRETTARHYKLKSYVWQYFDRIGKGGMCRICQSEIKAPKSRGTTGYIRHLELVHNLKKSDAFVKDVSSLPTLLHRMRNSNNPSQRSRFEEKNAGNEAEAASANLCMQSDSENGSSNIEVDQPRTFADIYDGPEVKGTVWNSNEVGAIQKPDYMDYAAHGVLRIVLGKSCSSSNLERVAKHENGEVEGGLEEEPLAPLSDDRKNFDHCYSRESGAKQTNTRSRSPVKRQRHSSGNDDRKIKSEELRATEFDIQVPLQYHPSFTTDAENDRDDQTSTRYKYITTEKAGKEQNVAVITLNRPKALNALCKELVDEVNDAVTKFDRDDSIGAVIITGNEKAFAAGTDLREMQNHTYAQAIKKNVVISWSGISQATKPVIAAVNGYALGGGCELALMCDIIYAGEQARFGQPEIVFGTIPGSGGSQRLTKVIGKSKAMEMVLTGNQISAAEAEKSGLVSKIFPPEQLLSEAIKLGERISAHSALIVSMAKEAVNSAYETTLQEGLHLEKKLFCGTLATADRREGMNAFIQKRAPKFRNE